MPKGIVCDQCNDYFGRKVEQPVLALPFFSQLRARNAIASKKKRFPPEKLLVYHPEVKTEEHEAFFIRRKKGMPILHLSSWDIAQNLVSKTPNRLIVESVLCNEPPVRNLLVARWLAKMAYEVLTQSVIDNKWNLKIILEDVRLYPLRDFARFGSGPQWEYYVRDVYGESKPFYYTQDPRTPVDVLYNYGHFFIEEEMYFTIIIKGYEFTMNMGRPGIEFYIRWLLVNKSKSAIYSGDDLIFNGIV